MLFWIPFAAYFVVQSFGCHDQWVTSGDGQSCFRLVVHNMLTWEEAKNYCDVMAAKLATLADRQEQTFISESLLRDVYMHGSYVWLGATGRRREGDWRWVGGQRLDTDMFDWADGKPPKRSFKDCLTIVKVSDHTGGLENYDCQKELAFICERPDWTNSTTDWEMTPPRPTSTIKTSTAMERQVKPEPEVENNWLVPVLSTLAMFFAVLCVVFLALYIRAKNVKQPEVAGYYERHRPRMANEHPYQPFFERCASDTPPIYEQLDESVCHAACIPVPEVRHSVDKHFCDSAYVDVRTANSVNIYTVPTRDTIHFS